MKWYMLAANLCFSTAVLAEDLKSVKLDFTSVYTIDFDRAKRGYTPPTEERKWTDAQYLYSSSAATEVQASKDWGLVVASEFLESELSSKTRNGKMLQAGEAAELLEKVQTKYEDYKKKVESIADSTSNVPAFFQADKRLGYAMDFAKDLAGSGGGSALGILKNISLIADETARMQIAPLTTSVAQIQMSQTQARVQSQMTETFAKLWTAGKIDPQSKIIIDSFLGTKVGSRVDQTAEEILSVCSNCQTRKSIYDLRKEILAGRVKDLKEIKDKFEKIMVEIQGLKGQAVPSNKEIDFQQTLRSLEDYRLGFQILSSIASITRDPKVKEFVGTASTVGNSAVNVVETLQKHINRPDQVSSLMVATSFVGAASILVNLMAGAQPSDTAIIMKGIYDLRKQISAFQSDTMQSLYRLEKTSQEILEKVSEILAAVNASHAQLAGKLGELSKQIDEKFSFLSWKVDLDFQELRKAKLEEDSFRCIKWYQRYDHSQISPEDAKKCAQTFLLYATEISKQQILSPVDLLNTDFKEMEATFQTGLPRNFNYLSKVLTTKFGLHYMHAGNQDAESAPLANPSVWAFSSQAYLTLAERSPENFSSLNAVAIDDLIEVGEQIQTFRKNIFAASKTIADKNAFRLVLEAYLNHIVLFETAFQYRQDLFRSEKKMLVADLADLKNPKIYADLPLFDLVDTKAQLAQIQSFELPKFDLEEAVKPMKDIAALFSKKAALEADVKLLSHFPSSFVQWQEKMWACPGQNEDITFSPPANKIQAAFSHLHPMIQLAAYLKLSEPQICFIHSTKPGKDGWPVYHIRTQVRMDGDVLLESETSWGGENKTLIQFRDTWGAGTFREGFTHYDKYESKKLIDKFAGWVTGTLYKYRRDFYQATYDAVLAKSFFPAKFEKSDETFNSELRGLRTLLLVMLRLGLNNSFQTDSELRDLLEGPSGLPSSLEDLMSDMHQDLLNKNHFFMKEEQVGPSVFKKLFLLRRKIDRLLQQNEGPEMIPQVDLTLKMLEAYKAKRWPEAEH